MEGFETTREIFIVSGALTIGLIISSVLESTYGLPLSIPNEVFSIGIPTGLFVVFLYGWLYLEKIVTSRRDVTD